MIEIRYPVYRAEWQSRIDGVWFPGCEYTAEIAEAIDAQQRWRTLGYNTVIRESQESSSLTGSDS